MIYRFGEFEMDVARLELRRAGEPVTIQPKVFRLLRFLLEHRERVVGKDELLDALWKDTVVTESSLTFCVNAARREERYRRVMA